MKKLLIFDGNSILNRAFYGIRVLSNSKGQYTNGVYGFLNIFFKFIEEEKPDYLAVAFDLKAKTFRHKMYDGYKAQRKGMPPELAEQMPYLKEILSAMNVSCLQLEGFEADDIIGTVSKQCDDNDINCVIVTGDKDDLQLASDKITVRLVVTRAGTTTTTDYDYKAVLEKMGVTPEEFISVKALMGDTSDNIPGVKGIGEKSAFSLIQQYKTIDNLYEHTDELKGAQQTKIIDGKDMAYLSYGLSKIDRNVPVSEKIDDMLIKEYNKPLLYEKLSELELKSIITKLGLENESKLEKVDFEFCEIASPSVIESIITDKIFYLLNIGKGIESICIYSDGKIYRKEFVTAFEVIEYIEVFSKIFGNPDIKKVSHDIKKDIVFLSQNYGIEYSGQIFDTKIAAYILEPSRNSYEIGELAEVYLRIGELECDECCGILESLECKLSEAIKENEQEELLYEVEFPLVYVLACMEKEGFRVNKESLAEFSEMLNKRISVLENEIYDCAGEVFNINSPKQLGVILFEKLGLPAVKKTKTGYSTNADVLEKLKHKHIIISYIMEYRVLAKLKSTYADGLYNVINESTGKINSSFNQTITTTGRISSTEPNLQNIPVRLELGREIRKMFVASDEDHILVDADYSQIELRVLAHIAEDKTMSEGFVNGIDVHSNTASQVFGVPIEMVTSDMRSKAKAVNFGIVYGIGSFSLSQDIHVTKKQADEYIQSYFDKYTGIKTYLDNVVEFARENGYVKTLLNRRRYIPEIKASNFNLRSFGERVAMNAPIQGYAADIIKIAMVKVYNRLKAENLLSKLILQVHDELIVDALKSEEEQVKKILKEEMENAVKLNVPLVVEMKSGNSWYETK